MPMDFVVTEAGIHAVSGARLEKIDAVECRRRLQKLIEGRRRPALRVAADGSYSSPVCYAAEFPGYFGEDGDGR